MGEHPTFVTQAHRLDKAILGVGQTFETLQIQALVLQHNNSMQTAEITASSMLTPLLKVKPQRLRLAAWCYVAGVQTDRRWRAGRKGQSLAEALLVLPHLTLGCPQGAGGRRQVQL